MRERFVVAAPVAGRLQRIDLHEGDAVEAGAVVASRRPGAPRPAPPARPRRACARPRPRERRRRRARNGRGPPSTRPTATGSAPEELGREGLRSAEERERAVLAEVTAAAEMAAARHAAEAAASEVAEARAALLAATPGRTSIASASCRCGPRRRATVLRVLQESDRVVAAGTPLFELGRPRRPRDRGGAAVLGRRNVRPGATMWVEGWGGGRELEARVRRVEPSGFTKVSALGGRGAAGQRGRRFRLAVPTGLGDGFRVEVRVVVWESPGRAPRCRAARSSAPGRTGRCS